MPWDAATVEDSVKKTGRLVISHEVLYPVLTYVPYVCCVPRCVELVKSVRPHVSTDYSASVRFV